jgi:hypothetical protein
MCTKGHSTVQEFASNACGFVLRTTRKRPPKYVIDAVASPTLSMTEFTGLLSRGRNMETFDPPKHITPAGCHYRSLPTRFELDVWWTPAGLHQREPRRKPTWACRHLSYYAYPALTPIISYPMSPRDSATSTLAVSFMGTLRGYAVVLELVLSPH